MDCSVEGCTSPAKVRGLCRGHYQRFQRTKVWPTTPLERKQPGRICDVPGCGRPNDSKGLCHSHYAELVRTGRRPTEPIVRLSPAQRFATHVRPGPVGCLLWTGSTGGDGRYGSFSIGGKLVRAHRWAYEQEHGPIPDGLVLDHLCRVTLCVNPAHLEPVTQRENVLRGEAPSALNAVKTHCDKGHPLDGDNLVTRKDGGRQCRACTREIARAATRRWRERKRAA